MTTPPGLFRQEALEFRAGEPRPGGVLRVDTAWSRWSYWIVLMLVVVGVIVTATTRTYETTSGPALIDAQERTFMALVPDAAAADLRRGQVVRLSVPGREGAPLAARVLTTEVADEAGIRGAGLRPSSQPAVLVRGSVGPDADLSSPRQNARAVVILGSQTILDLFLRQLHGAFGKGGDG
jgi:hypothetical protein